MDTVEQWRARFDQFKKSGKTVISWCEEHGFSQQQFYYWKKRLRELAPAGFVELRDTEQAPSGISIAFRELRIELAKNFDPSTLSRLLASLRQTPC
jgi:transposase-like protein